MLLAIENVLDDQDLRLINSQLEGAAWQHGGLTATGPAQLVKNNLQLDLSGSELNAIRKLVLAKLQTCMLFQSVSLPRHIFPPLVNCYRNGGEYGLHTDSAIMTLPNQIPMRSDLSVTLFLTPAQDYDGGELSIESAYGAQSIKLEAGAMIVYPSDSLHCVHPVTRGSRIAVCFWVQSLVADSQQRQQLFELDQSIQALTLERGGQCPQVQNLSAVYHNLVRMWAVP